MTFLADVRPEFDGTFIAKVPNLLWAVTYVLLVGFVLLTIIRAVADLGSPSTGEVPLLLVLAAVGPG